MTVSVPGCVRGWGMLLERFGTRPLASLLGPAIHYAEGFPTSWLTSQAIDEFASLTPDPEWHRVFRAAGRAPRLGEPLVQSDLARTLRDLGAEGPDLFYTGRVGRAIADRMAADGFLGPEDLAEHAGEWGEPIATTYRGFRVYETPPPTQGLAALIALNILERFPLARRPLHSVQHLHLLLEVVKLAYADRDRWIGDPAHARVPLAELLDKKYAARRRKAFDARKAQAYAAGDPEGDTTGFVVADGHGNVASVIQSLFNPFGSGIVVPGCGVLLQNRGRHFQLDANHPSALAPPDKAAPRFVPRPRQGAGDRLRRRPHAGGGRPARRGGRAGFWSRGPPAPPRCPRRAPPRPGGRGSGAGSFPPRARWRACA